MDSNKDLCQVPPNFRRDVNNRCDILKVKAAESLCRNKKKIQCKVEMRGNSLCC